MFVSTIVLVVIGFVLEGHAFQDVKNDNSSDIPLEFVLLDGDDACNRKCIKGAAPMICKYTYNVEWYETMSKACYDCPVNIDDCFRPDCIASDGYRRPVLVINRQMPGPAIEVCEGDQVVVDVVSFLSSETTTIHWHGQPQKENPYMDGVPNISQCPILPLTTYRYDFKATYGGTQFWHSHNGVQRGDGAYGAVIVRRPAEDNPHNSLYDHDLSEHVIQVIDWDRETGMNKFLFHYHSIGDNKPSTILVNGLGKLINVPEGTPVPEGAHNVTSRFTVEKGDRYRFRVINAGFQNCPIELSIDNHTLTVISSDGYDFKPIDATSLVIYAGERFDFILNANQPDGLYWIKFRGLVDCNEQCKSAFQVAVLQYKGANASKYDFPDGETTYENSHNDGLQVNGLNRGTEDNSPDYVPVPRFQSLQPGDDSLKPTADHQFYLAYDFYELNNPEFNKFPEYGVQNVSVENRAMMPQINHISMKFTKSALMPQRDEFQDSMFCNKSTIPSSCKTEFCQCYHVIQAKLNSVVEMVLIDEGAMYTSNHPLHLHGYAFRVVAMERLGENTTVEAVKERDRKGLIKRNLIDAPLKDTVTIPDGGYTIIRFVANNPGYWLFHCHIEYHVDVGMGLIIKVGEHSDMVPVPKNIQKCGDYSQQKLLKAAGAGYVNLPNQLFGFVVIVLLSLIY